MQTYLALCPRSNRAPRRDWPASFRRLPLKCEETEAPNLSQTYDELQTKYCQDSCRTCKRVRRYPQNRKLKYFDVQASPFLSLCNAKREEPSGSERTQGGRGHEDLAKETTIPAVQLREKMSSVCIFLQDFEPNVLLADR